jgi:curved DNA-binding protein CbpA
MRALDVLELEDDADFKAVKASYRRLAKEHHPDRHKGDKDAAKRAAEEEAGASAFRQSAHYQWAGPGDGTRSRDEMRALDTLELKPDADFPTIRKAYRQLAKEHHPDLKQGDEEAAKRFQAIQAAYEVLKSAEERRTGAKV